jgi:6-phospho-3-hexuloisomerase
MAAPAPDGLRSWHAVRDEVAAVLSSVSASQMAGAAALFTDRTRRWFCSGQGRSGLVAQMVAMRLMHVGFDVHAVGEPTAPSVNEGDGLVMISGSDSTLAGLAHAVIEVPVTATGQFGGSLFEQSALLLLDAVVLEITAPDPQAHADMKARHTNLQ